MSLRPRPAKLLERIPNQTKKQATGDCHIFEAILYSGTSQLTGLFAQKP